MKSDNDLISASLMKKLTSPYFIPWWKEAVSFPLQKGSYIFFPDRDLRNRFLRRLKEINISIFLPMRTCGKIILEPITGSLLSLTYYLLTKAGKPAFYNAGAGKDKHVTLIPPTEKSWAEPWGTLEDSSKPLWAILGPCGAADFLQKSAILRHLRRHRRALRCSLYVQAILKY